MNEREKFLEYVQNSMKELLRKRAEEIVRVKIKSFYLDKKGKIKDETKIKEFLDKLDDYVDNIVKQYVSELKKAKLDSPQAIMSNEKKVDELAKNMEIKLKKKLEGKE